MRPHVARNDFFSLYRHGFARVAVATPLVRVGDPRHNGAQTLELMRRAARAKVVLAVFPELGLSAYSCEDLFHQRALLDASEHALAELLRGSRDLDVAALVGLPSPCVSNYRPWVTLIDKSTLHHLFRRIRSLYLNEPIISLESWTQHMLKHRKPKYFPADPNPS
jgi:predicted amidohydrolase